MLAIGQALFFSLQTGDDIPYSEFKAQVHDGQVHEVDIAEDRVRGTLKTADGKAQAFNTVRIEDPKLVEELEQHGVKSGEITNRWVAEILGWVIPLSSWSRCGASSSGGWAAPKAA